MSDGPYRDGAVHVLSEKCSDCIYRPGNKMALQPGRVKQMADDSVADGGVITCHQTLPYGYYGDAEPAVCRGFFDARGDEVQALQVAERLGMVEFDDSPSPTTSDH